ASSADVSNAALPVRPLAEIIDAGNSVPDSILTAAEQAVHPSDPATMIYTSGSTSAPKGVIHSHRGILTRTTEFAHEFSIRPDDRVYSSMPLFWVGGLGQILLPLLANGACTATLERPDPAAVRALIESERLTRIFLYPQRTATSIVNDPAWQGVDLSSIERGLPGLPGISLTTFGDGMGLGMSETFAAYAWGRPEHPSQFTPPMRRLSAGWSVKVITDDGRPAHHGEEGEILVRGPSLCIGLQKRDRDEVFDADGFYRTGDYVLVDGGALRFRGRRGDMIKSAGANVAAAEVETALRRLEGVDEAFVVGIPDQDRGAVPGAAVVAKLGATLSEAGLLAELGKVLAGYKLPRRILILDSVADIPMTPTGKLRQHELRELLTN
ncbi:MAG TPA: AMP-binding protein, partial [Ilumatobacteraceae bacterium]|nr:AMP-binding protein [Ilumatobacteraceae bacterium]